MDNTKTKILNASSKLFLKGGAGALSVRAIAAQAGISTIGIYSYFQGKQGILDTLYIEGFERVSAALDVPHSKTAKAAVLQACQNYLDSAEEFQAHYRLIFGQQEDSYSPSEEARAVGVAAFKRLTKLVARLLPDDAPLSEQIDAAIQVWSVIHGFVSLRQHLIAQMVSMANWKIRTMLTLEDVIDGIKSRERTKQDAFATKRLRQRQK
jgi:AcrR family transcriptional regulator